MKDNYCLDCKYHNHGHYHDGCDKDVQESKPNPITKRTYTFGYKRCDVVRGNKPVCEFYKKHWWKFWV